MKTSLFALCMFVALGSGASGCRSRASSSTTSTSPDAAAAKLEIVRVDDSLTPFEGVDTPNGIELRTEWMMAGDAGAAARVAYATAGDRGKLRSWLDAFPRAPNHRFGIAGIYADGEPARYRSVYLVSDPIVLTSDLVRAAVIHDKVDAPVVGLTLSAPAAARFAAATREWSGRRIAIVVDDEVVSTPIVKGEIDGGHLTISMGDYPRVRQSEEANRLARALVRVAAP